MYREGTSKQYTSLHHVYRQLNRLNPGYVYLSMQEASQSAVTACSTVRQLIFLGLDLEWSTFLPNRNLCRYLACTSLPLIIQRPSFLTNPDLIFTMPLFWQHRIAN